jgi:hypothetical protein
MFAMEARFWLVPYAALVWWPEICMERGVDTRRALLLLRRCDISPFHPQPAA